LAVGTDTCGSVRIPSAYCGVAGLLPSVGVLPRDGVVPLARSLDRVGLIAATAADLELASSALGVPGHDGGPDPLAGLRVGIPPGTLDDPLDPAVAAAFEAVLAVLRAAGVEVGPVPVDHAWAAVPAGIAIFLAEGMDHHRERWARTPELVSADVRATLAMAEQVSGADYVRAQRVRTALRAETLAALSAVDVLLTPAMPSGAPPVEQATAGVVVVDGSEVSLAEAHLRFNVLANLAALPSGTQPVGMDVDRLPVGVQWVAAPGADRRLLAVMAALEAALGPLSTATGPSQ
jgi:aspartyl-tRNA(Asn)/glutamyl-tRNA(Gln) amidotransferase subunit A